MVKAKRKKVGPKKAKKKGNSIGKFFLLILLLLIGGALYYRYSPFFFSKEKTFLSSDIPPGFSSFGIDVSHHQGIIDWYRLFHIEKMDTLIHFVYCKATEGSTHIDTQWESNRKALNQLGVNNGAYHFFCSTKVPRPQAAHFLTQWQVRQNDLPPVLDVETEGLSDDDLRAKMTIWLEEVELKTGMRPIIYTSYHFFQTKFKNYFPSYKFWIACYSHPAGCIADKRIIHWQYSEKGLLPGLNTTVDLNVSTIQF